MGSFSLQATPIWDNIFEKHVQINSPDGKKAISATYSGDRVILTVRWDTERFEANIGEGVGSEAAWSPDSKAFFVTSSNEGRNGIYDLRVFLLDGHSLKTLDPTPIIREAFGHPVLCGWPEPPNVAGVAWLGGSNRLLIAAQIVHHSNCDSFGTFRAYELELPQMKIVQTHDQLETKRLFWKDLGEFLREANDECRHNPKSCEVPSNHPKSP